MAEEKLPNSPENDGDSDWKRVTSSFERGDALKEGPYVNISRNGAVEAGAEATAMALDIAQARGYGLYEWAFDLYSSEKKGQNDETTPGSQAAATEGPKA